MGSILRWQGNVIAASVGGTRQLFLAVLLTGLSVKKALHH